MRRFAVRIFAAIITLIFCPIGIGAFWAWDTYHSEGAAQAPITIIIKKGAALQDIADQLYNLGVISNKHLFLAGAYFTNADRRMRAGEFSLDQQMSMHEITDHLLYGETVKRRLTVPEGMSTKDVVALVARTDGLYGEVPAGGSEGIYLPETYFFSYGDSTRSVLLRMESAMKETLIKAWQSRMNEIAISSPDQALILASIIERETGVASERARVSGVFHNRLRRNMRLQSDSTVIYAVSGGATVPGRRLKRSDLNINSDYNTYRHVGLPPGPISNPGRAAILAATRPAVTADLYFVADGTGGHAFARTLQEHNRNVAKWRLIQRRRAKTK